MPFASLEFVRRIERAEGRSLAAVVEACADGLFIEPLGEGLALCRGPGSPLNKVVGLGFAPLEERALAQVEARYSKLAIPVQIELATHADVAVTNLLVARGYRLTGFENVLGRALTEAAQNPEHAQIEVRRATAEELEAWVHVLASGFLQLAEDERAAEHDSFGRAELEAVFHDMARKPTMERWIAYRGSQVAGGANLSMEDGIAQLFGAATHPTHRRHGVQSALLAARIAAARDSGCDVAVITTQPGSKSQQNAERAGFRLLYARAVWVRKG